ncbi:MAG: NAD-dependent deacetylase [Vicinamibacterales bacterium]
MIDRVASWIRSAERVVVLTGAGMSAESGVPVFRGPGGLWRQFKPEDLATPDAFEKHPTLVWEWYVWRRERIAQARPHAGHTMIAELEARRTGVTLLTQNVDGLHQRAGSPSPVELHGNLWRVRCARGCGFAARDGDHDPPRTMLHCRCGAWLRPEVVWFGEALDARTLDAAVDAMRRAQVALIVGTSAVVYPVAALPDMVRDNGGRIVEINVEETPLSARADAVLRGPAGLVLTKLAAT